MTALKGKAWTFGRDIDTDLIIPARYLNMKTAAELAEHVMEDADPEFPGKVTPGDIIVADNDGVAVVPRAKADQVAEVGRWIFEDDEVKRGKIYDRVGKPRDWTVEGHTEPPPPSNKVIH